MTQYVNKIANTSNIFYEKLKNFKGIHLTDPAEIIEIDSLYPSDLKKCWELILVSLIFCIFYNEETRCELLTYARFLIKIANTSQTT